MEAHEDRLSASLAAQSAVELDRLQTVFEDHINRFAFREGTLAFDWRDGSPSTNG